MLDDILSEDQLKGLPVKPGSQSKMIATSCKMGLLQRTLSGLCGNVPEDVEAQLLRWQDSQQMLCLHAFGKAKRLLSSNSWQWKQLLLAVTCLQPSALLAASWPSVKTVIAGSMQLTSYSTHKSLMAQRAAASLHGCMSAMPTFIQKHWAC